MSRMGAVLGSLLAFGALAAEPESQPPESQPPGEGSRQEQDSSEPRGAMEAVDGGAEVTFEPSVDEGAAGEPEAVDEALPEELVDVLRDAGYRYTLDLTDDELARRWRDDPASLGSISVGRPEEGRLINAMPFPEASDGGPWTVVVPESCWTTRETADFVIGAANQLREWFPEGAPVRVGQVSGPEGGFLPPHVTHQVGRDVDIGLFYPGEEPYRVKEREKVMDVAMNWAFVKALMMHGDVQYVLLDWRVQNVLYAYALKQGEDRAWLDSLFKAGPRSVFHHARKHRDHFHVRYWNPRAQELAYRLAPLMPVRPEENVALHKVKKGDTLGAIAVKYGSSVARLKRRNGLSTHLLRVGQVLRVPLKGPCTECPVAPIPLVPPRRGPPNPTRG
ncbi:MAG: penicillin-insensitive murein endopeptidase [Myxococcaceae bacterium]|nr:penicillin-insensitive murein endopeptidase [Myxococcaceae bacterium]